MADSTARTLALLSLLQTHRHWTGPQIAARLGVSERTVRRDIDRLRDLGYQVDAAPGVAGGYQLAAGAHLPPLLFDDDEAVALAVGLRSAAGASIEGIEESALGVMAKLEQMLPDHLRRRVDAVHSGVSVLRWSPTTPAVAAATLATLTQACRDREEVRFEYRRRDGDESSRLVRPHQLVSAGRRWYLVAWDVRRADWRTFRVDRMEPPRLAGGRFEALEIPGGDAAEFVARSLAAQPGLHRATVIVTGPAAEADSLTRWLGATVEHLAGQRSRLTLTADATPWLASMVAMIATHIDVEIETAPDDVRERVSVAAARLAGAGAR
jgi:predicted DNA-binding transcriptional regulator YafY